MLGAPANLTIAFDQPIILLVGAVEDVVGGALDPLLSEQIGCAVRDAATVGSRPRNVGEGASQLAAYSKIVNRRLCVGSAVLSNGILVWPRRVYDIISAWDVITRPKGDRCKVSLVSAGITEGRPFGEPLIDMRGIEGLAIPRRSTRSLDPPDQSSVEMEIFHRIAREMEVVAVGQRHQSVVKRVKGSIWDGA